MSFSKKDEDMDSAIFKVDRTSVFQEGTSKYPFPTPPPPLTVLHLIQFFAARLFNNSPISPRKCRTLLTKMTYLLYSGEKFPVTEATSLFFGITKLFQHKDASLRQMVYLVIKELASTAEDVIMVTSSIMKDTAVGSDVLYRANAIRALCRIIDVSCVRPHTTPE